MKTMTMFAAGLMALTASACGDDGGAGSTTVGFGSVTLPGEGILTGEDTEPGVTIDGATFNSFYIVGDGFTVSAGFTISDRVDTETAGFMNAFSAYPGMDADGDGQFAVWNPPFGVDEPAITFEEPSRPVRVDVANNTYAALSMAMGDQFAKMFTTEDEDFFVVTFVGLDAEGEVVGMVDHYLGDFRTEDAPGIQDDWQQVSLSSLGTVSAIDITFDSSDVSSFGINTPSYVAIDAFRFR